MRRGVLRHLTPRPRSGLTKRAFVPRGVMDQLPVEISQRIRHEARVAGLHDHAPSIEMVERRRLQLWSLTIVVIVATGLTALAVSGASGNVSWITGEPMILAAGVAILAIGFGIYAI